MSVKLISHRFVFLSLLTLIALVVGSASVSAFQSGEAEISGAITDNSGAVVSGAVVTVTEINTNKVYETKSSATGVYGITNLRPGLYRVTVEAPAFKRLIREGVQLATGERIGLDLTIEPGKVEETITVKADAPLLRTETGSLGQVIDRQKVLDLPLNGRSFISLAALSPNVALPPGSSFPRINGGRPRTNEYLFDGISVLQPEPGQVAFSPVIDAIQEFKIELNDPSADIGRFNGGAINLTTKSGTNDFHGSLFEFFRNEALNARNFFAPATAANPGKPLFRRNQYGFVFGGPIVKDRTFFFVDYQGSRQEIGRVRISTVPTLAERNGNFSAILGAQLFREADGSVGTAPTATPITVTDTNGAVVNARVGQIFRPSDKLAFAGNIIPTTSFDSIAAGLLSRYPLPTSSGAANNFSRIGNEPDAQDQFDVRLDHRISARDQVFGRYSYAKDLTSPVTPLPDGSGNLTSGVTGISNTIGQSIASSYIHTFNDTTLNEFRFGYTRRSLNRASETLNPSQAPLLPGTPSNAAFQNDLPTFTITGFQQLGPTTNTDSLFRTDVTELVDSVSFQRGRHSLKAGLDWRWERLDVIQPPAPAGQFTFTSLFSDSSGLAGTGNALASFLLGQVQSFSIDLQQRVVRPRAHIQEYFIQDDWKVTPRLSVSAGLRYTLNFPSTDADNQGAVFNLQTQKLDFLGQNGFPDTARKLHKLDFGPRLGLAYRINDKTVVRTGYGVIWIEMAGITTPFTVPQFPFLQTTTQRNLNNSAPAFVLANGPTVAPIPLTPDAGLGQGVFSVNSDLGSGYAQQWNLAIQREIGNNFVFEVAYAGNKVTHLGIPDSNINQLTAAQLQMGAALLQNVPNPFFGLIPRSSSLGGPTIPAGQLLKPFPEFTTVSLYRNNVGNSNYNAIEAKLEKRLSKGLSFLVGFTHSRLIDEASSVFDASILTGPIANFPVADSFNRKLERDASTGDIPNIFIASFTYELPFGHGHNFDPAGIAGSLVSGWELAGVVTTQSGIPLAVTQATNFNAFAGFGTQRPNQVGVPDLPTNQQTVTQFFNTAAFAIAPQFTIGTSSRNPVRGPHYRDADISLIKRTRIGEGKNFEFRTEVFNLTNTPPLGAPNVVLGAAGFGSITSAGDPRVIQFAAKLNF